MKTLLVIASALTTLALLFTQAVEVDCSFVMPSPAAVGPISTIVSTKASSSISSSISNNNNNNNNNNKLGNIQTHFSVNTATFLVPPTHQYGQQRSPPSLATTNTISSNRKDINNRLNRGNVQLNLFRKVFRRNGNDGQEEDDDNDKDTNENNKGPASETASEKGDTISSYAALQPTASTSSTTSKTISTTSTSTTDVVDKPSTFTGGENDVKVEVKAEGKDEAEVEVATKKELSPLEKAQQLRAQAERARLEAEKMDIVLTIQKIEKLERELEKFNTSHHSDIRGNAGNGLSSDSVSVSDDDDDEKKAKKQKQKELERQEDIRKQIESLKKKLNDNNDSSNGGTNESKDITKETGQKYEKEEKEKKEMEIMTVVGSTKAKSVDEAIQSVFKEVVQSSIDASSTANANATATKPILTNDEIEKRVQKFNAAPAFMKELVVNTLGMTMDDNLNVTEVVLKMEQDSIQYYQNQGLDGNGISVSSDGEVRTDQDVPIFTQEQIDEVVESVKLVPQFVKNMYGDEMKNNDTAIALLMLEEEWKEGRIVEMPEITQQMIDKKLEEVKWVPQFLRGNNDTELALELIKMDFKNNPKKFRADLGLDGAKMSPAELNENKSSPSSSDDGFFSPSLFGGLSREKEAEKSDSDNMIESLFPKTTRREGEEPTEKEMKIAMTDIFAKDNTWSATGKPEKIPGGYIIRGITKYETGKELMAALEKNLEKSSIRDQISMFYVFDPTPVTEDQMEGGDRPPVLFIAGPKVVRDPAPIQRSIISSLALGTVWYNALVPYLLNDKYMKLADEQLALADASMTANLDFLNDLSFPLFASILGIQVAHEVAHAVAAKMNKLEISFPTLVPSLESGLTGAITSLQAPPKDKQALFDFAIAGPLTGILVSVILMFSGMFISSSMDAATFSNLPALPLDLLRQSSLAGGIIDAVNPGLLSVPDAALGTQALSGINIPLHPLTIAGYFGLMVNAINLLPVGRTDGGRISLTLFGRSGTQLVSLLTFVSLFIGGVMGSDLLLFFFSYVIFFQSELEIPQQNEVDDMDFSRVLLATATGVLVLLTLIPM